LPDPERWGDGRLWCAADNSQPLLRLLLLYACAAAWLPTACAAATHLLIYECCHRQAVEAVCERPPQSDVVPPLALIIEPVNPVDASALVVAS
jgi:hypothetical protein